MQGLRKSIRNTRRYLTGQLARGAVHVINFLPQNIALGVAETMGKGMYVFSKRDRDVILANLTRVYGDTMDQSDRESMGKTICINLARTATEAVRIRQMSRKEICQAVHDNGLDALVKDCFSRGRSMMIITGHYGNWELFAARVAMMGPLTVLARKNSNPGIEKVIQDVRDRNGVRVLDRSEKSAPRKMIQMGKEGGHILGILMDQDTSRIQGIFSPFMGFNAYTPSGPASIAIRNLYEVYVVVQRPEAYNNHTLEICGPLQLPQEGDRNKNIQKMTDQFNNILSKLILKQPEYWVWNHRRWKTQPEHLEEQRSQ